VLLGLERVRVGERQAVRRDRFLVAAETLVERGLVGEEDRAPALRA